MNNQLQMNLLRYQLRKKEATAKAMPYISFLLTHLVQCILLFLFVVGSFVDTSANGVEIKVGLAVLAILLLDSEWIYAAIISKRWKKDIDRLWQLEQARLREEEEALAADLQRQRHLDTIQRRRRVKSVRPNPGVSGPQSEQSTAEAPGGTVYNANGQQAAIAAWRLSDARTGMLTGDASELENPSVLREIPGSVIDAAWSGTRSWEAFARQSGLPQGSAASGAGSLAPWEPVDAQVNLPQWHIADQPTGPAQLPFN